MRCARELLWTPPSPIHYTQFSRRPALRSRKGVRIRLVPLTSSIFYGGPERQMLGMADALPPGHDVTFVSFAEDGRCEPFLTEARRRGYAAIRLNYDTPRLLAAARELSAHLREIQPD